MPLPLEDLCNENYWNFSKTKGRNSVKNCWIYHNIWQYQIPPPQQYQVLLLINFFKFHIHILSSPENEFILKSQQCSSEKFYKANIGYYIHFRIT